MTRSPCIHLGRLIKGRQKTRPCHHPDRGGECERLKDCASCPLWTPRDGVTTREDPKPVVKTTRIALPCIYDDGPCAPPPAKQGTLKTFIACEKRGPVCKCECGEGKCSLYVADNPDAPV